MKRNDAECNYCASFLRDHAAALGIAGLHEQFEVLFAEDSLQLQHYFRGYHRTHSVPMLSLRYETERSVSAVQHLALYLSQDSGDIQYPGHSAHVSGSRSKEPRVSRTPSSFHARKSIRVSVPCSQTLR